jgi:hypothetical protein
MGLVTLISPYKGGWPAGDPCVRAPTDAAPGRAWAIRRSSEEMAYDHLVM